MYTRLAMSETTTKLAKHRTALFILAKNKNQKSEQISPPSSLVINSKLFLTLLLHLKTIVEDVKYWRVVENCHFY